VKFEPTIPAFERVKTVPALNPDATVISSNVRLLLRIHLMKNNVNIWITAEEFLLLLHIL
jgi:hypothetical protein